MSKGLRNIKDKDLLKSIVNRRLAKQTFGLGYYAAVDYMKAISKVSDKQETKSEP